MAQHIKPYDLFWRHLLAMWIGTLLLATWLVAFFFVTSPSSFFAFIDSILFISPIFGIMAVYTIVSLGGRMLPTGMQMIDRYKGVWLNEPTLTQAHQSSSRFRTHLIVLWIATFTLAIGIIIYFILTGQIQDYMSFYVTWINILIFGYAIAYTVIVPSGRWLFSTIMSW